MSGHEQRVARLATMSSSELRDKWRRVVGSAMPRVSPSLLRLALAWEIQASALGGFARSVAAALDQLARGLTPTAPPAAGMRLVREWGGKVHVVTVGERGGDAGQAAGSDHGAIRWDGREWRSLSEVARAITGNAGLYHPGAAACVPLTGGHQRHPQGQRTRRCQLHHHHRQRRRARVLESAG